MKLPEKLIPKSLMKWMDKYLTRRVQQLKQETIKQTWRKMQLEKAVDEISNWQQNNKQYIPIQKQ